ncbi:sodium/potassium-transporting ATPase subunit beta-1-like [Argonauta hians]
MASSDVDPASAPSQGGFRQSLDDFLVFIYNRDTGEVCGRTGKSWFLITLFYLIFYGFLAGFFSATIAVFYTTVEDEQPKLQGTDSLLMGTPGLGYRPRPNYESTLIKFTKGDNSMSTYVDNIKDFLDQYNVSKYDTNYENCDGIKGKRQTNKDKPCLFDPESLKSPCLKEEDAYGYKTGVPCVILKLNKIYNWIPVPYSNDTVPSKAKENWDDSHITVTCEGERDTDKENIQNITYYPKHGFPIKYFPYRKQKGYHSPIVIVRLQVTRGILLMIECRAYAQNIRVDRAERQGAVHFELLVD